MRALIVLLSTAFYCKKVAVWESEHNSMYTIGALSTIAAKAHKVF